jgi:hypothetical protein
MGASLHSKANTLLMRYFQSSCVRISAGDVNTLANEAIFCTLKMLHKDQKDPREVIDITTNSLSAPIRSRNARLGVPSSARLRK